MIKLVLLWRESVIVECTRRISLDLLEINIGWSNCWWDASSLDLMELNAVWSKCWWDASWWWLNACYCTNQKQSPKKFVAKLISFGWMCDYARKVANGFTSVRWMSKEASIEDRKRKIIWDSLDMQNRLVSVLVKRRDIYRWSWN